MYVKIINGAAVFPPQNDGNKLNVNCDPAWLTAHGYTDRTPAEIAAATLRPAAPPKPTRYSKLALFDALGLERWNALTAQLDAEQQKRLELANELSADDADFAAALAALTAQIDNATALLTAAEI